MPSRPTLTRSCRAVLPSLLLAPLAAVAALPSTRLAGDPKVGAATIVEREVTADLEVFAQPRFEGRDAPDAGAARAARFIAKRFAELGLEPCADSLEQFGSSSAAHRPWLPPEERDEAAPAAPTGEPAGEDGTTRATPRGTFLRPFQRPFVSPVAAECSLELAPEGKDEEAVVLAYGADYVPVADAKGSADGELVFAGFGISWGSGRCDAPAGGDVEGRVVTRIGGEPLHAKRFGGLADTTDVASLWNKLETLKREKVAGVLVVRRSEGPPAFRYAYATFSGERAETPGRDLPPALVVSPACASTLLGTDVGKLAEKMDRTAKPSRWKADGRRVRFRSSTQLENVAIDNVVGIVRGSDEALRDEYVVVGAHYDHIGVGPRGRTALGADDNASGSSALLAVARAMVEAQPRRSVIFASFAMEEDGLVGSKAFCGRLPVTSDQIVAMLNLDMIGVGDKTEVVVLGLVQNPALESTLDRALRLSRTGIREFRDCRDPGLFERSDHHSFHQLLGVPVLFFFENYPVERNPDYHTWRDTVEPVA